MRYVLAVFTLLLISSCAAPARHKQPLYASSLSASDIAEITALAAQRSDIRKPVYEIATDDEQRDRFVVYAGRWERVGDAADYFTVQKKRGQWRIVSPIRGDTLKRIITLNHDLPPKA